MVSLNKTLLNIALGLAEDAFGKCRDCGDDFPKVRMEAGRCDDCHAEHEDLNADDPRDFDGYEQ